ncbi:ArsC family protein [Sulfitobacter noctilucae]|uniref:ArsC/Spx/MgsR family protein n=1 Tax=Sulfitobacter noctilucae TaxID=1342302 RepID=UPI0004693076|nr:ArsC/Spx/MgsR family protein [Sulfitobacter noctilucae]KIN61655.1 ArsC family protein [Sulfitobacter noctilucae]
MIIYGLKNCDTCRKAIKAFPDATFRDVRSDGVPDEVLQAASDAFGSALVNTRSTTWRGLDEAERDTPQLTLLKRHPSLMKRPLIDVDNSLFLSWNIDIERDIRALL